MKYYALYRKYGLDTSCDDGDVVFAFASQKERNAFVAANEYHDKTGDRTRCMQAISQKNASRIATKEDIEYMTRYGMDDWMICGSYA